MQQARDYLNQYTSATAPCPMMYDQAWEMVNYEADMDSPPRVNGRKQWG